MKQPFPKYAFFNNELYVSVKTIEPVPTTGRDAAIVCRRASGNAAEAEVCDLICCLSDLFCGTFHIIEALCLRKDLFVGCVVGCDGSRLDRSLCHIIDNTET